MARTKSAALFLCTIFAACAMFRGVSGGLHSGCRAYDIAGIPHVCAFFRLAHLEAKFLSTILELQQSLVKNRSQGYEQAVNKRFVTITNSFSLVKLDVLATFPRNGSETRCSAQDNLEVSLVSDRLQGQSCKERLMCCDEETLPGVSPFFFNPLACKEKCLLTIAIKLDVSKTGGASEEQLVLHKSSGNTEDIRCGDSEASTAHNLHCNVANSKAAHTLSEQVEECNKEDCPAAECCVFASHAVWVEHDRLDSAIWDESDPIDSVETDCLHSKGRASACVGCNESVPVEGDRLESESEDDNFAGWYESDPIVLVGKDCRDYEGKDSACAERNESVPVAGDRLESEDDNFAGWDESNPDGDGWGYHYQENCFTLPCAPQIEGKVDARNSEEDSALDDAAADVDYDHQLDPEFAYSCRSGEAEPIPEHVCGNGDDCENNTEPSFPPSFQSNYPNSDSTATPPLSPSAPQSPPSPTPSTATARAPATSVSLTPSQCAQLSTDVSWTGPGSTAQPQKFEDGQNLEDSPGNRQLPCSPPLPSPTVSLPPPSLAVEGPQEESAHPFDPNPDPPPAGASSAAAVAFNTFASH